MKTLRHSLLSLILLALLNASVYATNTTAGFFLPDSLEEMTIKFKSVDNLVILPVTVNDTIAVNLILDTGCRNLVLFGKRFQKIFKHAKGREVTFSGLGSGSSIKGSLRLDNVVRIESIVGNAVPLITVPDQNLFARYSNIHGIIGYDVFLKFEIEINSSAQTLTFRKAAHAIPPASFSIVPLTIVDSRPILQSKIEFVNSISASCDLMIDTGSSIGLLLKTTDIGRYEGTDHKKEVIGRGLNGLLYGFNAMTKKFAVKDLQFRNATAGIISSDWHNYASVGMEILKDYIVVLNYCKAYAGFKKIA